MDLEIGEKHNYMALACNIALPTIPFPSAFQLLAVLLLSVSF
jgi:hypothetical protein